MYNYTWFTEILGVLSLNGETQWMQMLQETTQGLAELFYECENDVKDVLRPSQSSQPRSQTQLGDFGPVWDLLLTATIIKMPTGGISFKRKLYFPPGESVTRCTEAEICPPSVSQLMYDINRYLQSIQTREKSDVGYTRWFSLNITVKDITSYSLKSKINGMNIFFFLF